MLNSPVFSIMNHVLCISLINWHLFKVRSISWNRRSNFSREIWCQFGIKKCNNTHLKGKRVTIVIVGNEKDYYAGHAKSSSKRSKRTPKQASPSVFHWSLTGKLSTMHFHTGHVFFVLRTTPGDPQLMNTSYNTAIWTGYNQDVSMAAI